MKRDCATGCAALLALCLATPAAAADLALPALPAQFSWTGLYVGGHVGYSRGDARFTIFDPAPGTSGNHFGSLFGGVQAGYNHMLAPHILVGVEADISFPNYLDQDDRAWTRMRPDGSEANYRLAGDQFAVEARILKWHPWANLLGLHTAYELDRVTGRYERIEDEQQRPRTVFPLSPEHRVDLFGWRARLPWLAPLVDAEYGSSTFTRGDRAARYEVRVSTTGLLVREVP